MAEARDIGSLGDLEWLRKFAVRLAREEADDVVQETLLTAWRFPSGEAEPRSRQWLATVMRNRLRMSHRSEQARRRREQQSPLTADEIVAPDMATHRLRVIRTLVEQLEALPERDRTIIMMRYFEGHDASEIGRALGLPASTVRGRLRRALHRLREQMDQRLGKREVWAAAVGGHGWAAAGTSVGSVGTATGGASAAATSVMAALSKMGWATLVALAASVVGVLWIVDPRPQPRPDASPVPALEDEPEPTIETPAPSAKDVWAQRRALLRRKHASHPPSPDVDARDDSDDGNDDGEEIQALIDEANEAREAAFDECQKDIGRGRGALVLRYRVLGAPDVGTIIDIIDVVGDTEYRTELVECVQESMYSFLGGFPPVPFERTETVTYLGPRAEGQDEKTWKERIFQTVVTAHLSEVRACETIGHGPDSEVAGRVTLEMSFGGEPNAIDARIVQTDTSASVSDCILTAARTWMFPRPVLEGHTFTRDISLPIDPAVDDVAQAE